MSAQHIPKIRSLLAERPFGASAIEIARVMDAPVEVIENELARMVERGEVEQSGRTWRLNVAGTTPPIFRAMETLEAMQLAARGFE
jgi:hypothetical protein